MWETPVDVAAEPVGDILPDLRSRECGKVRAPRRRRDHRCWVSVQVRLVSWSCVPTRPARDPDGAGAVRIRRRTVRSRPAPSEPTVAQVFEHCDEPPSASRDTCCRDGGGEQRHAHPVSWGRPSVSRHSRKRGGLQADKGAQGTHQAILQPATPEVLCANRRGEPYLRRARRLPFTRSTWLPFRGAGRDRRRGRLRAETAGPSG